MARQTTPLTAKEIQSAKPRDKEYKLFDGGGLYLAITPKGGKWWRLKYRFNNKEHRLSVGVYPSTSLQEARKSRELLKEKIAKGINPTDERKDKKEAELIQEITDLNTFETFDATININRVSSGNCLRKRNIDCFLKFQTLQERI